MKTGWPRGTSRGGFRRYHAAVRRPRSDSTGRDGGLCRIGALRIAEQALAALTAAQYGRNGKLDDSALDQALDAGNQVLETRAAGSNLGDEAACGAPCSSGRGHARVVPLTQVPTALRDVVMEWRNTRAATLLFTHRDTAILAIVALIGLCFTILVGRALTRKKAGRTQVALPAVLDWSGRNWTALVRHGALLLFLAGLPFFTLALADPYSSLTREDVSYPGRRICLMIDASSSMMARFPAAHLNAKAPNEATFFTTVAAAETFIRQRMNGKYHDLDRPRRVRRRGLRRDAVHHATTTTSCSACRSSATGPSS